MKPFRYHRANSVADAVTFAAANPTARFLGGGTNLVDLMKLDVETPELVIDVRRLPLAAVEVTSGGGLRIGAVTRNSVVAAHPMVREQYPMLSEALLAGASGQVRNAATIAGNLLQRTRCPYFLDVTKPCNKRQAGSGCPARDGDHQHAAIFGASKSCIATHPSDLAVALLALDAVVLVSTADGPTSLPIAEFYRRPGDAAGEESNLAPGALVTGLELPPPRAVRSGYRKVRDRASFAFAVVSVAVAIDVSDAEVRDVRLAFGGVAPMPWRARVAERALLGTQPDERGFGRALDLELAAAEPLPGNAYKPRLVRSLAMSTLAELVEGVR